MDKLQYYVDKSPHDSRTPQSVPWTKSSTGRASRATMMQSLFTPPVRSEARHYPPLARSTGQRYQSYVSIEHVTSAYFEYNSKAWTNNFGRPHLNITLDGKYCVNALVDSGRSLCLGDSSLISQLKKQFPIAPPGNVTDCHNNKKPTLGCYRAMLSVDDPLPYPLIDKTVDIHMTENLSSELILGSDFLGNHGGIVSMKSNKVIFLLDEFFVVTLHQKPIVCEAFSLILPWKTWLTTTSLPKQCNPWKT